MKLNIQGRYAIVEEATQGELYYLAEKLTWSPKSKFIPVSKRLENLPFMPYGEIPSKQEDTPEGEFTSILFINNDCKPYFFANLLIPLSEEKEIRFDYDESLLPQVSSPTLTVSPDILENITLRDYQVKTINKVLWHKSGIFHGATGFGKTAVIIALTKFYLDNGLASKVLIITPNLAITDNMVSRFGYHNLSHLVSAAGGKFSFRDTPVIIGNINTVYRSLKSKSGLLYQQIKDTDMMIYDECHHASAYTSFQSAIMIDPSYLYGFSGTPYRESGTIGCYEDALVTSLFGRLMASVPTRYLIRKGYLAQPYVFMKDVGRSGKFYPSPYAKIYDRFILNNETRNQYIADYARLFVKAKLKTLILVQRLAHIDMLLHLLSDLSVLGISGSNIGKLYNPDTDLIDDFSCSYEQAWADLSNGKYQVVVASVVADEGVDIPSVGALIVAGSGKSVIKAYQRTGRGLRSKSDGENMVFVLDFNDNGHAYVRSHSKQREGHYLDMGAVMLNEAQFIQMLMDSDDKS